MIINLIINCRFTLIRTRAVSLIGFDTEQERLQMWPVFPHNHSQFII